MAMHHHALYICQLCTKINKEEQIPVTYICTQKENSGFSSYNSSLPTYQLCRVVSAKFFGGWTSWWWQLCPLWVIMTLEITPPATWITCYLSYSKYPFSLFWTGKFNSDVQEYLYGMNLSSHAQGVFIPSATLHGSHLNLASLTWTPPSVSC